MQAQTVQHAIQAFSDTDLKTAALNFFKALGYSSKKMRNVNLTNFLPDLDNKKALVEKEWQSSYFLFQLTDKELQDNLDIFSSSDEDDINIKIPSYFFAAIELNAAAYSRPSLVEITRSINKASKQPVLLLFKHRNSLTFSVIHRRVNQNDKDKDVLEKVTLLKDIRIENTHRAHLDILTEFSFNNLPSQPKNFVELHHAWHKVLDTKELNKKFYGKLFDWYLFALSQVEFPQIRTEADKIPHEQHQSESLIRLLTRLLFVWFMKEKGLVNAELFNEKQLKTILKNFVGKDGNETIYYKAILQNLFFATLNKPINERKAIDKGFNPKEYGDSLVYRYAELFADEKSFVSYFENVPFLNGGLFDCLDQRKDKDNPIEIRLDGFSTRKKKQPIIADKLFFGEYKAIDLSAAYDNKNKNKVTVYGLIDILQQYKFTVEENTPTEEDIALDPELLGRVFENLLAAYNPETKVTARKQTGSFYTPREIVDYMVEESLKSYFKSKFENTNHINLLGDHDLVSLSQQSDLLDRIDSLLSDKETIPTFSTNEKSTLINAINHCKILDPACGSGAFPMGILHKLVFVLTKIDPENTAWRELQKKTAIRETEQAYNLGNHSERAIRIQEINDVFDFNASNYGRKLYLIENCIHGVDIQPIAVQISKLRFFISLIVDQKSDPEKDNFGIRALPNLDFKIVAANTLIAAPSDGLADNLLLSDTFFDDFNELTHDYFKVSKPDEKKRLRAKIEKLINAKCADKIKEIDSLSFHSNEEFKDVLKKRNKKQIDDAESHKNLWQSYPNLFKHEAVKFFEPCYFFPQIKAGFDIVIGNPPYIQIQKFSGQQCQKDWQNQKYATFEKTGDIYALFIEKGVLLLKLNGVLTFITSNKWMRAGYGQSLRKFLAEKTQPLKLIDFGDSQLFENATTYTNILITKNSKEKTVFNACAIEDSFTIETPLADYFLSHQQKMPLMTQDAWVISSSIEQQIKTKIEAKGTPLKDWDVNIYRGVLTGFNEAFIIDTATKERLCLEDPKSEEIIKPILRGRDIKRYSAQWAKLWVILAKFHSNEYLEKDYLVIYNHLRNYKEQLEKRGQCRYGGKGNLGMHHWLELDNCPTDDYLREFSREKIIYPNMTSLLPFCYDKDGFVTNQKCFILTGESLKYLVSFLNSKLFKFAFKDKFPELMGKTYELSKIFFEKIAIPKIPPDQQQPFIDLVDKILIGKKTGENTAHLEREIDQQVYALYGLTDDEINIIEGGK